MRVLITNDDGIGAAGLAALTACAQEIYDDVHVVAPMQEQSGVGQGLSLHRPLRVLPAGDQHWSVSGTPVDCILVALGHLLHDKPPDLVLSGINHGPNIGWDIYYSGTVAGAREAVFHGIPAVALSLVGVQPFPFARVQPMVVDILRALRPDRIAPEVCVNVNIPADAHGGVQITRLGHRSYGNDIVARDDPRGRPYYWIGGQHPTIDAVPGTDGAAISANYISITPLGLDVTAHDAASALAALARPRPSTHAARESSA